MVVSMIISITINDNNNNGYNNDTYDKNDNENIH